MIQNTNYSKKDIGKRTVEFVATVPQKTLDEYSKKSFDEISLNLQIEGFRKGKVPENIAKKHIKKETIYDKMLQLLLPDIYTDIVKKEDIRPVVNPKIELVKAKDGEEWEIKFTVALAPETKLGDYKKAVAEVKKDQKGADIWVPGKDPKEKDENKEAKRVELLNKILEAILKTVDIEISPLIIEEELHRRLTKLLDDVSKIGMTIEDYVKSKNTTVEALREQFKKEIEETYKLELALEQIADDGKIVIEKEDLEKVFQSITDEKAKQEAEKNAYFYASLLKRQKTLDYLIGL